MSKMLLRTIQFCAAVSLAAATDLFVASYSGNITTLSLTEENGRYSLTPTHFNSGCEPNPSWLTLDPNHGTLYCLDEGLDVENGTLSSFLINDDGSLDLVEKVETVSGPVSGVIYGNPATGRRAIALAHYTGSTLSDWTLNPAQLGAFQFNQDITFNLNHSGPNADRQEAPHEHEAILDPTGQFVLVPDLGADLVRVFSFDPETLKLSAETPLSAAPGSGPRHAVFYQPYGLVCEGCTSYMFLVSELANTVTSYAVTYPSTGGMSFEKVFETTTYGNLSVPVGNAAAEITISPDNRFLIVSNRNDTLFNLPNPDPGNSTSIPSDTLSTFKLRHDGTLDLVQLWPAGGSYPRHFSLNQWGNLIAVGLQLSSDVVVMERDVESGFIGKPVGRVVLEGEITNVQWRT